MEPISKEHDFLAVLLFARHTEKTPESIFVS